MESFVPSGVCGWRAAYRCTKLTQRVWQEMPACGYVSQSLVALGGRLIQNEEPVQLLKFDLREYTYEGRVQWVSARLYQGQTTYFRTPGGGFAPVFEGPVDGSGGLLAKSCVTAQHESRLFLLAGNQVQPLAHDRYVAPARGEAAAVEISGRRFILVDWYLRMTCGQPAAGVNETCSWLVFDAQGAIDPHAAHAIDAPAVPTEAQWASIRALVFGTVWISESIGAYTT